MRKLLKFPLILSLICLGCVTSSNANVINVDLVIKNHKFEPEILKLPAGKKIRITVHNQDSTIEEFESVDLKREKIIPGKSKARIILAPLNPGEYKFFGEFHEETAQGKIIITEEEILTEENNKDV